MKTIKRITPLLLCLLMIGCADKPTPLIERYTTEKSFTDVTEELEFAITEKNFRVSGNNTIGKGLRDRGHDNYPDIEVIQFCSLELAREVLDIDPGFVAHMPCRITVHEENEKVVISLLLLPTDHKDPRVNEFSREINIILHEIVNYVLEENSQLI